ncbi:YmzC family protein [Neobacillus sp. LXY-4]|uniref:YmzC family protein n=1 Tax=Neobacillus sp. LXY-4 TaxID=3379826 RepID=UPI003EE3372B
MIDSYLRELRNIRITLVILTIILAFTSGNRTEIVHDNTDSNWPQFQYSNMVQLENGHFGVLSGDSQARGNEQLKIYYYDAEKNEVILKKETPLSNVVEVFE